MAKNKGTFIIPSGERKAYNALVQRANRRIQANMKYIQKEDIRDDSTQRALLGRFTDKAEWHTEKIAFSRTVKFEPQTITDEQGRERTLSGEQVYKRYLKKLNKFGGIEAPRTAEGLKEGYYKAIIKNLTVVALDNPGVLTKKGHLPANIAKKVGEMTLEQMKHYFDEGDPIDEFEYLPYSGEDYMGVDREMFVDVTLKRLNTLKELYPSKQQKALRETYGKKYPDKSIFELEKIHNRELNKRKKKKKKKKKRK